MRRIKQLKEEKIRPVSDRPEQPDRVKAVCQYVPSLQVCTVLDTDVACENVNTHSTNQITAEAHETGDATWQHLQWAAPA